MSSLTAASQSSVCFPTRLMRRSSLPSSIVPRRFQEPSPPIAKKTVLGLSNPSCRRLRMRRRVWEAKGGDAFQPGEFMDLEDQLLEFMDTTANPDEFPTKDELIAAGRMDLVVAVATQGGWMAYGWDLDEDEVDSRPSDSTAIDTESQKDCSQEDIRLFQLRFSTEDGTNGSLMSDPIGVAETETCAPTSTSGRPIEPEGGEDVGIEGIFCRLERERSSSYSSVHREKEVQGRVSWRNGKYDPGDTVTVGGSERSARSISSDPSKDVLHDVRSVDSQNAPSTDVRSPAPEAWRMVSRAGSPVSEFEAAEIIPDEAGQILDHNFLSDVSAGDKMHKSAQNAKEVRDGRKEAQSDAEESCKNQIYLRLQNLESELTSTLDSLRSRDNVNVSHKGQESSLNELHRLSDDWEFQETEMMKARDKLRSMRAKLAVLEGKLALQIIEAQKIVDAKQKRIESAHKALRLLRSSCIIWPNSASEVLLTGSFDGWTSQRRMERSSTGVFSLYMKLYPGQYEIKFVVDGVWTIDPLRPIVYHSGYENNLLIIP